MRKILAFCLFQLALFSSCKKDYTCTCSFLGELEVTEFSELSNNEAEDLEMECIQSGLCIWAEK